MKTSLKTGTVPGTVLTSDKLGGVTGKDFIDKVFYVTDGIMLSQIREITGIDGTTLQNWVKRGWVDKPVNKTYSREQLARILLLSMMRDTLELSEIIALISYISGDGEIDGCGLYDCVCRVLASVSESGGGMGGLDEIVISTLSKFDLPTETKKRVLVGVRIIVVSYYASTMKSTAGYMLAAVLSPADVKNG